MAALTTTFPVWAGVVVVTSTLIDPVIPTAIRHHRASVSAPGGAGPRGDLLVPDLTRPRAGSAVYGLAILDCNGRIADHHLLRALGWDTQTRLDIREQGGLLLVSATAQGVFALTRQGHLRLPATARRWFGPAAGDQVLLAAQPELGRLVVHPPAALDAMVGWLHGCALGGDRP